MSAQDPRGTAPQRQRRPGMSPPRPRRRVDEAPADVWPADPPPATPNRPDWRDDVVGAAGLNLLAGIWLIVSPWVVNYTDADAWWNPIVSGAIVATLALVRFAAPARTAVLSVINAVIGVWLFISGFWLADSGQAAWNEWILGVIVFVLAAFALGARREPIA